MNQNPSTTNFINELWSGGGTPPTTNSSASEACRRLWSDDRRSSTTNFINEVWSEARKDPTLQSTLNIENLLQSNTHHSQQSIMSLKDIAQQNMQALKTLHLDSDTLQDICQRLLEYRLVDSVHELTCGKYLRWIRCIGTEDAEGSEKKKELSNGGILSDIKFLDNGVHLSALAPGTRFPRKIKYDNYLIFQKMTEDDVMLCMSQEIIHDVHG